MHIELSLVCTVATYYWLALILQFFDRCKGRIIRRLVNPSSLVGLGRKQWSRQVKPESGSLLLSFDSCALVKEPFTVAACRFGKGTLCVATDNMGQIILGRRRSGCILRAPHG